MRSPSLLFSVTSALVLTTPAIAQQTTLALPTYTAEQRWARAGELGISAQVGELMQAKARGLTAEAWGQEIFKMYGPPRGWVTSNTPFVLFRGMYNNFMSHPQQQCLLLEASEIQVKAECNRPYAASVRSRTAAYGVTLEEYEKAGFVFAQSLAEFHGMTWTQELRLDNHIITIRKK